jgi:hypothetical protein
MGRLDRPDTLAGASYNLREVAIVLGVIASICLIAVILLL